MKNRKRFLATCIGLLISCSCFSQVAKSSFYGTWKADANLEQWGITNAKFDIVTNQKAIFLIQSDSGLVLTNSSCLSMDCDSLASLFFDVDASGKSRVNWGDVTFEHSGEAIFVKIQNGSAEVVTLRLTFDESCCGNHAPSHCASSPLKLKELKEAGCGKFKSGNK